MTHLQNAPSFFDELEEGEIRNEEEFTFFTKLEETCKERLKLLLSMQNFELKKFKLSVKVHKMEFEVNCKWKFPNFRILKKDFEKHIINQCRNFIAMQIEARNNERILNKNWMEMAKNGKPEIAFFETPITVTKFSMERFDCESEMRVLFSKMGNSKSEKALKEDDTKLNVSNPKFPPISTQNPNLENVQNPDSSILSVIEHANNTNSTNEEMTNVINVYHPYISNISEFNPPQLLHESRLQNNLMMMHKKHEHKNYVTTLGASSIDSEIQEVSSKGLISSSINTNNTKKRISKENKKLPLRRSKRLAQYSAPINSEKKHKSQPSQSQSQHTQNQPFQSQPSQSEERSLIDKEEQMEARYKKMEMEISAIKSILVSSGILPPGFEGSLHGLMVGTEQVSDSGR